MLDYEFDDPCSIPGHDNLVSFFFNLKLKGVRLL